MPPAPSLLARLTDREQGPALPEAARNASADGQGLVVLLAEDNEINAMLARKHIERLGARVERVSDGGEAVELAEASVRGERPRFDLVLLDIRMPVFDGHEVARRIRALEAELDVPPLRIVALTANAFEEDRRACMDSGFDEFLTKPVDFAHLAQVLTGHTPSAERA